MTHDADCLERVLDLARDYLDLYPKERTPENMEALFRVEEMREVELEDKLSGGKLMDYQTGKYISVATLEEAKASLAAGHGNAILSEGRLCYVEWDSD